MGFPDRGALTIAAAAVGAEPKARPAAALVPPGVVLAVLAAAGLSALTLITVCRNRRQRSLGERLPHTREHEHACNLANVHKASHARTVSHSSTKSRVSMHTPPHACMQTCTLAHMHVHFRTSTYMHTRSHILLRPHLHTRSPACAHIHTQTTAKGTRTYAALPVGGELVAVVAGAEGAVGGVLAVVGAAAVVLLAAVDDLHLDA